MNGVSTRYAYLGSDLAVETDANWAVRASYFFQPGVDRPISRTDATSTVYYLQDHAGSVTALARHDGTLIGRYAYSPWGEVTSQDAALPDQPLKWTSRELDSAEFYYLYGLLPLEFALRAPGHFLSGLTTWYGRILLGSHGFWLPKVRLCQSSVATTHGVSILGSGTSASAVGRVRRSHRQPRPRLSLGVTHCLHERAERESKRRGLLPYQVIAPLPSFRLLTSMQEMLHIAASGRTAAGIRRWFNSVSFIVLSIVLVLAIYLGLAYQSSSFRSFWSPDSGARFAMIRSWVEQGHLIYLHYPVSELDPMGALHPLGGYATRVSGGFCTAFPPFFPFLSGLGYRVFGYGGLLVPPVLGGLGTVWLTYLLARELHLRAAPWSILLMGLATPLVLYSCVFWDHSLHMLLVAASGYFLLRALQRMDFRWAVAAGMTLGVGVWLHELLLALSGAFLTTSVPVIRLRQYRWIAPALLLGLLPHTLAWIGGNLWIYSMPGGAHVQGPHQLGATFQLQRLLDWDNLTGRVLPQLIGSVTVDPLGYGFAVLLLAYAISTYRRATPRWISVVFLLSSAATALLLLLRQPWAEGLFLATPLLILALAIPGHPSSDKHSNTPACPVDTFYCWMRRASLVFTLLVLANPLVPGLNWGSRYLLTLLPLLFILAAHTADHELVESPPQWRRASVVTVLAVVGISFFSQYRGWLAIRHDLEENQALVQTVEGVTSPLLVTDVWWLGAEVAAADFQATQVLVEDSDGDRALLAAVLREMSPQSFTYLGRPHGFGLLSSAAEQNGWGYAPGAVRQQVGLVSAVFQRQETRKERPPFASPSSFRGRRP